MTPELADLRADIAQMLGFPAGSLSDNTKLNGLMFCDLMAAARKGFNAGERAGFERGRDAAAAWLEDRSKMSGDGCIRCVFAAEAIRALRAEEGG